MSARDQKSQKLEPSGNGDQMAQYSTALMLVKNKNGTAGHHRVRHDHRWRDAGSSDQPSTLDALQPKFPCIARQTEPTGPCRPPGETSSKRSISSSISSSVSRSTTGDIQCSGVDRRSASSFHLAVPSIPAIPYRLLTSRTRVTPPHHHFSIYHRPSTLVLDSPIPGYSLGLQDPPALLNHRHGTPCGCRSC